MSIVPGHENLQRKEVLGINNAGELLVSCNDDVKRYRMYVMPNGGLACEPVVDNHGVDQDGKTEQTKILNHANRWLGVDQSG